MLPTQESLKKNFVVPSPIEASAPPTGANLYARFALAGALCCGITHGAMIDELIFLYFHTFNRTPVDVVKTRIQLSPEIYNKGMIAGFRQVVQAEGAGALLTGFGPTAAGYFLQGAFKFGGYEFWKKTFIDLIGVEKARENRTAIYLGASAIAEFFADVALCPLEATRIRLVSQPTFASGLLSGFSKILKEEGAIKGFYSGFGPILFKQVPYTMAKFVVYERTTELILKSLKTPKEDITPSTMTVVNLSSGIVAGTVAAIVSQPADTLLSKINKQKGAEGESLTSRLLSMSRQLGVKGLFLGLGPRIVMVATLTAGQFAIYGDIKRVLGATGGVEIAK
ncbi:mitochondrial carrier domain-containing protein [Mycotypha africana]|uniref:mitochondrial carrier domain-containing protein n=1 Tax=Mycotypha africana TaxID=64632 RepID=UPI0023007758|nr:mitochondrial carrier domain-containing protein [Mycotypha africana]KAI8971631.1 mitochondrial carrier domain-containing protein [Mycotypha africana]